MGLKARPTSKTTTLKLSLSSINIKSVLVILLTLYTAGVTGQCHNNCNQKGECDFWGRCHCFEGYEGPDCGSRSCPKGKSFADIAHGTDAAHREIECSGRGSCISATGQCKCLDGYYGTNCGKSKCPNDCNNHGRCLSLRESASQYDGFALNYSSSYNLWDADLIHGCICDPGWGGHDCSEQTCDVGVDPRVSTYSNELVSMVCECSGTIEGTCFGKFKLQFLGHVLETWFHPLNRFVGSVVNGEKTLTITDITFGKLSVGQTIAGAGIPDGTTIVSQKTITGLKRSALVICSTTSGSTTLTVTHIASGAIAVGNIVIGAGIAADTTISAFVSGSGGLGTYLLSSAATATATLVSISAYSYGRGSSSGGGGKGTYEISASAVSTETDTTITSYTIASEISSAITNSVSKFFGPSSSIFVTATASGSSTVAATGASDTSSSSASICAAYQTTTTAISFQRQANDMPSIAFYSNRFPVDTLYFKSTQTLTCNCGAEGQATLVSGSNSFEVTTLTSGLFRVNGGLSGINIPSGSYITSIVVGSGGLGTYTMSQAATATSSVNIYSECSGHYHTIFDGEVGSKLAHTATVTELVSSMNNLRTIKAAKAEVYSSSSAQVCTNRNVSTATIHIKSPAGNLPRPSLWSSVYMSISGNVVSNLESALAWTFSDGRDSTLKECNGIGKCHRETKNCTCPFGWESDFDFGPCGKLTVNTSDFLGIGRCPGSIRYSDFASTTAASVQVIDNVPNYHDLAFMAFNPDPAAEMVASGTGTSLTVSVVNSGLINVGDLVYGPSITDGTTISAASTASVTVTTYVSSSMIDVTAVSSGTLGVGYFITGSNIPSGAYITALGTGTGTTGTYIISEDATSSGSLISVSAVNGGVGVYTISSAVSSTFSNRVVKTALKTADAVVTAGVLSGGILTVTATTSGTLKPYQFLSSNAGVIPEGTIISSDTYLGTYTMTTPATAGGTSESIVANGLCTYAGSWSGDTLSVSSVIAGRISVGQTLSTTVCGVDSNGDEGCALPETTILMYLTGTGGTGTYRLSKTQAMPVTCTACVTSSSMTLLGTWSKDGTSLTVNSITSVSDSLYHGLEEGDAISGNGISNSVFLSRWSHAVFTGTTRGTDEAVVSCYWRGNVLTVFSKTSGSVKVGQTLFGSEFLNDARYNYALSTYTSHTYITSILAGTEGTYRVSHSQSISSRTIEVFVGGFINAEVTGSITGDTLTVTAVSGSIGVTKNLAVGMFLRDSGGDILAGTEIIEILDNSGGVGSYTLSEEQDVRAGLYASQITLTTTSKVITVTSVTSGVVEVGQTVTGTGITNPTKITAVINGTNGVGFYAMDTAPTTPSTDITITATSTDLNVTKVNSGTIGIGQILSDTDGLMIVGTSISDYATSATFRATVTSGSASMSVPVMINGKIAIGQKVIGAGIPTDTFISSIDTGSGLNGTYTLSKSATSDANSTEMTTKSVGGVGVYTMSVPQAQTSRDVILDANTKISARNSYTYQLSDTSFTAAYSTVTAYSPTYKSLIDTYTWYPAEIPLFEISSRQIHTQLGSAFGGDKVLVDQGGGNLFYIDKVATPYIGKRKLDAKNAVTSQWLLLSQSVDKSECEVYAFIMDAAVGSSRRKLFWSTSCTSNGKIWYVSMDATSPSETALSASNSLSSYLFTPKGLAVHYGEQKLYFVDEGNLHSCKFDGSSFTTEKILDVPFSYTAYWSAPYSKVEKGKTLRVTSLDTVAVVEATIALSTTLTVTVVTSGTLGIGQAVYGTGIPAGTYITALGTGTGKLGTYIMSQAGDTPGTNVTVTAKSAVKLDSFIRADGIQRGTKIVRQLLGGIGQYKLSSTQTVASDTILTATSSALAIGRWSGYTLTITSVSSGRLMVGQTLSGIGITEGTVIVKLGTGDGGTGTYIISKEHKNVIIPASITASSTVLVKGSISDNVLDVTEAQVGHRTVIASGIASWQGTTLTIESCTSCNFAVGMIVEGSGIRGGEWSLVDAFDNSGLWTYTTITALGTGTGGPGTYTMSRSATAAGSSVAISGLTGGILAPSQTLTGAGISGICTIESQLRGGVGAYNMSVTQSSPAVVTATLTASSTNLVVTNVASGQLQVGDEIYGDGIPSGTTILSVPSGGGEGTYTMSAAASSSASSVEVSVVSTSGTVTSLFSQNFLDLKLNFAQNNTANVIDVDRDLVAMISLKDTPSADILENPQFVGFSSSIFDVASKVKSAILRAGWSGTLLTVVTVSFGKITVGSYLSGPGITKGTYIVAQNSGPSGLEGTYTISQTQLSDSPVVTYTLKSQTASSFVATWTSGSESLTVDYIISGGVAIGHYVSGPGIVDGSYVVAFVSGTYGGAGVYNLSTSQTDAGTLMTIESRHLDRNPSLLLDDFRDIIGVVDSVFKKIFFYRYIVYQEDFYPFGHALTSNDGYGGVGVGSRSPVALSIDRGLSTPTFTSYLDCYGHGKCLGAAGNWVCECFDGWTGDCQTMTCPKGVAWFSEPAVDDVAHDVMVECSNAGKCDRSTGHCQCASGYEGAACERSQCGGEGPGYYDCSGRGRCISMRELAEHSQDKFFSPVSYEYGSQPDTEQWDADMIHGCLPDEYGYFPTDDVTAAKSYASPNLRHVHNISKAVGANLEEFQCPFSYDMRLEDGSSHVTESAVVVGNWTATTLTVSSVTTGTLQVGQKLTGAGLDANTYLIKFLTGTGKEGTYVISTDNVLPTDMYAHPGPLPQSKVGSGVTITASVPTSMNFRREVQTLTCSAIAGTFYLTFRGKTTEEIDALTCTGVQLKAALEKIRTIGTVSIEVVGGSINSNICNSDGVTLRITFETELGDVPLLVSSGTSGAVVTASWNYETALRNFDENLIEVTAVESGFLEVNQLIYSTSLASGTKILRFGDGTTGNVGTYYVSTVHSVAGTDASVLAASFVNADASDGSISGTTLTITTMTTGKFLVNSYIYGVGITAGTYITAITSGSGTNGTYTISESYGSVSSTRIIGSGVVTILTTTGGSKNSLFECAGRGTCGRLTGSCGCWDQYVSSDGFGKNGSRGDCGHNVIY